MNDDITYHCYTHLGHILHVGDIVFGYDLKQSTVINNYEANSNISSTSAKSGGTNHSHLLHKINDIPDVMLVQKQKQGKTGGGSAVNESRAGRRKGDNRGDSNARGKGRKNKRNNRRGGNMTKENNNKDNHPGESSVMADADDYEVENSDDVMIDSLVEGEGYVEGNDHDSPSDSDLEFEQDMDQYFHEEDDEAEGNADLQMCEGKVDVHSSDVL